LKNIKLHYGLEMVHHTQDPDLNAAFQLHATLQQELIEINCLVHTFKLMLAKNKELEDI